MEDFEHKDRRCPDQYEQIAERAAERAVKKTLLALGLDTEDTIGLQQDFATLRRLRRWRERGAFIVMAVFLTSLTGGILTLIWEAFSRRSGG